MLNIKGQMKPDSNLLISISKGTETKEEYSHYQEQKKKSNNDLKIDLTTQIFDKERVTEVHAAKNVKSSHQWSDKSQIFDINTLTKQDILLTQVPNLNEAGFFAGMATLLAYIRKERPDIKAQGIDPFSDYFFSKEVDLKSEFFSDFNTFSNQGQMMNMYSKYKEMNDILDIFYQYIEKSSPKYIGFSIIDGNIDATLYFVKKIKEKYPDVITLIGGSGVSIMGSAELAFNEARTGSYKLMHYDMEIQKALMNYSFVDFFVFGDGEKTLIELYDSNHQNLDDVLKWMVLDQIKGLAWQKNGEWILNQQRNLSDLSDVPRPDYTDFMDNPYYKKYYDIAIPITFSRGCNFRCTFCSVPTFVPLYRHKPIEQCLDEIGYWIDIHKKKFEEKSWYRIGMLAHDSILNGNPKWLEELCHGIIDKGYGDKITWGGNLRLMKPMTDIDTLRLYNKAGIEYMVTGFESASPSVLKHMKKNHNVKIVRKIFENIRQINNEAGNRHNDKIKVQLQLIIGYINESEEDFQMTLDFIDEFHDTIHEILTCSVFNMWKPLLDKWVEDGEWIDYQNSVVWDTKYNTTADRIDRIGRIEKLFDKHNMSYNTYNRGLMLEMYQRHLDER